MADTPENRRLAENTKIQSQVKYHADFEKEKGKLTQVADDPETLRIRNTSKIISNVSYHGEYEKKKQMEERRNMLGELENNNLVPTGAKNSVTYPLINNNVQQPLAQPQVVKNVNPTPIGKFYLIAQSMTNGHIITFCRIPKNRSTLSSLW